MNFCPRCRIGQVADGATECPICGYELPKDQTVAMHVADELEQTVRKELGRYYQVERPLGQGGMSVVYLARELDLNRPVAVKVLPVRLSFDQEAVKRFQREAKIAAGLDHPHVVPVYRVGTTPSLLWYSMKLVEGQSLGEILQRHVKMDLEECVAIIEQVGAGLHYAHRRGIVHRDIKPSNVMVDRDGWAWVCDFGVAKAFGAVPLTQTGSTLGTPRYMSPEQCYAGVLDGRSDQYSLAALTYEALAGQPLFNADSIGEYVHKHTSVPAPSLRETRPDLPDTVVDAVARALSKAPDKRFPDVQQFVQALGGQTERRTLNFVVAGEDPRGPITPVTPPPSQGPRSGARWRRPQSLGAAAVIVLAGLAAATPFLLRRAAPPVTPSRTTPLGTDSVRTATAAAPAPRADSGRAAPPSTGATRNEGVAGKSTQAGARLERPVGPSPRRATQPERHIHAQTAPTSVAPPSAPAQAAVLQLTTIPLGDLYIDGRRAGSSFQPALALQPGHHEIKILREGYEPFLRQEDVAPGDTVRILGIQLKPKQP